MSFVIVQVRINVLYEAEYLFAGRFEIKDKQSHVVQGAQLSRHEKVMVWLPQVILGFYLALILFRFMYKNIDNPVEFVMSNVEAQAFLDSNSDIVWHQRFQLSSEVWTPGNATVVSHMINQFPIVGVEGASVLDIGTCNGGVAFAMEKMGAQRVVGVDIYPPSHFGFDRIAKAIGSRVEFVQANLYELPQILKEQFDIVLFLGVLYHLRHPLLGIDVLRALTSGTVYIETAVSDSEFDSSTAKKPLLSFYPERELNNDGSNWFAPTIAALEGMLTSSGFRVSEVKGVPDVAPSRCLATATVVGDNNLPFFDLSYEPVISAKISGVSPSQQGAGLFPGSPHYCHGVVT